MSIGFLVINAIFFGVIAVVYTFKWFFSRMKWIEAIIWLASFVWAAYCATQVIGI